jgi:hypothetical protein
MPPLLRPRPTTGGAHRSPGAFGLPWGFGAIGALLSAAAFAMVQAPASAGGGTIAEVVRSFCLSAVETELAQAGKQAPAGMADFACACVTDRITSGSSIAAARSTCRAATSKRYPI